MTNESPFPFTAGELDGACRMGADALRARQTPAKLDRSRWKGCEHCTDEFVERVWKNHGNEYCKYCGRPLTEEAWAELERRIFQ